MPHRSSLNSLFHSPAIAAIRATIHSPPPPASVARDSLRLMRSPSNTAMLNFVPPMSIARIIADLGRLSQNATRIGKPQSIRRGLKPFWGGWAGMGRKPGTDMNFRRSLPEIRCLSLVCLAGYAPFSSCAPKRLSTCIRPLSPQYPADTLSVRRSEEHTSELQSRQYLVCRLLLEKKK